MEPGVSLPEMQPSEHVVQDFAVTGLSLRAHPVHFLRPHLDQLKALSTKEINQARNGQFVKTAGLILVRQRPGTAKGVCFITIKDETGIANLIVWATVFDKYRHAILNGKLVLFAGNVQHNEGVTHLVVQKAVNLNVLLARLTPEAKADIRLELSRADEKDGTRFPESLKNGGGMEAMMSPKDDSG